MKASVHEGGAHDGGHTLRAGGQRGWVDEQEGGRWAKGEGRGHREYILHPPPFRLPYLACADYISNWHLLPLLVDMGGWLMYTYVKPSQGLQMMASDHVSVG